MSAVREGTRVSFAPWNAALPNVAKYYQLRKLSSINIFFRSAFGFLGFMMIIGSSIDLYMLISKEKFIHELQFEFCWLFLSYRILRNSSTQSLPLTH
ncbi:hypothetical protein CEXT_654421 [Caerostris extrusa]|uniref:Uncharacterized protein n=1 Tax=Caerostris extrusa TaxID=172846 RepID=A0AAV4RVA5_CAEEX|nr:hypothetical protein CEXT_654421 [Caerostris extrusa]